MNLLARLKEAGCTPEDFDEMVHAAASELATNANNGGLAAQIEFLTENGYSEKDILNVVAAKSKADVKKTYGRVWSGGRDPSQFGWTFDHSGECLSAEDIEGLNEQEIRDIAGGDLFDAFMAQDTGDKLSIGFRFTTFLQGSDLIRPIEG